MTQAMTQLAAGDRSIEVPARDNTDEIGEMAKAVEVFKQAAIAKHELEEQQARQQAVQARRQEEIGQLVGFFGRSVGGVFTTLAEASATMTQSSSTLDEFGVRNRQPGQDRPERGGADRLHGADRRAGGAATVRLDRRDRPPGQRVAAHLDRGDAAIRGGRQPRSRNCARGRADRRRWST